MASTMTIYPASLDVESSVSVCRNLGLWLTGTSHTVKFRRYDVEHREIEFYYNGTGDSPEQWTHVFDSTDNCVYRVTGMRQGPVATSPSSNQSAILSLELDMLATWYTRNTETPGFDGIWTRLPMQAAVEPFQVRPAQMGRSRILASLPEITQRTADKRIVFVKVTAKVDEGSGYALVHLAAFCTLENTKNYLDGHLSNSTNEFYVYPSLYAIMNNLPLMLGVSSEDIYDVSVSEDCPVAYTFTAGGGYQGRDKIDLVENLGGIRLCRFEVGEVLYHTAFIEISTLIMDWKETTVQLQLDYHEVAMGQVQLIGSDNTVVTTIDTRYMTYNSTTSKWELSLIYRLKVDVGSMYTELQLPDGNVLRFTEGHLPWVGSAWADYVATQRNYDRNIAIIEKYKAQTEMVAGISTSLANGVFTSVFSGGAGAGTAVLGAAGAIGNYYEGERARENMLTEKEGLMRATPGTLYSPEYGVTYLNIVFNSEPMRQICLSMPIGVTQSEFDEYVKHHGYPVSNLELTITKTQILLYYTEGFIQGELTAMDPDTDALLKTGEQRRIFERQLREGVHYRKLLT